MSRPRRFELTALRKLPEVGLSAGDVVIVDRGAVPAVVRIPVAGERREITDAITDPDRIAAIARYVFQSRPGREYRTPEGPSLAVTPSYLGAQWTLENIAFEDRGNVSRARRPAAEQRGRREALAAALAAPVESAPREQHAAALLGTAGYHRLTRWLDSIRTT